MPPLTSEEYGPGRQIKRGDDILDVLGVTGDNSGGQYVIVTTDDTNGLAVLVPVTLLREEDSEFTAVDEDQRQAARDREEEDRQAAEARDREEFQAFQARQRDAAGQADPSNPTTNP